MHSHLNVKRTYLTGHLTKQHNEELGYVCSSPDITQLTTLRGMRLVSAEHVGERSGAYTVLVWKPEVKRLFEIPRCKRKRNIKTDFQNVGLGT